MSDPSSLRGRLRAATDLDHPSVSADARGATAHDDVLVSTLTRAVRRRRRARAAALSAGAVAAVGALVAGGVALGGDRAPRPAPAQSPQALLSLRCGADVTAALVGPHADEDGLYLGGRANGSAPADEPVPAVVRWDNRGSTDLAHLSGDLDVAATRDGVVVAVGTIEGVVGLGGLSAGMRSGSSDPIDLVPCGADHPLTAGSYVLLAVATVHLPDGTVSQVLSAPWSQTLDPPSTPTDVEDGGAAGERAIADLVDDAAATTAREPFGACGTRLAATADDTLVTTLQLDVPSPGASPVYRPGDPITGALGLVTAGGATVAGDAPSGGAAIVLTRAGVVVASTPLAPPDAAGAVALGPDDVVRLAARGTATLCGPAGAGGEPAVLPPGRYEAFAVLDVDVTAVQGGAAGGRAAGTVHVRSQPVDVELLWPLARDAE